MLKTFTTLTQSRKPKKYLREHQVDVIIIDPNFTKGRMVLALLKKR